MFSYDSLVLDMVKIALDVSITEYALLLDVICILIMYIPDALMAILVAVIVPAVRSTITEDDEVLTNEPFDLYCTSV